MKGFLLAIILVICFNGVAKAESWVLWVGRDKNNDSNTVWTIEAAFPSYELCIDRLKNACGGGAFNGSDCSKFNYLGYATWYFKCFPSTIDPRK